MGVWDQPENFDPVEDIRRWQEMVIEQYENRDKYRVCPPHLVSATAHRRGGLTRCSNCAQIVCARCGSTTINICVNPK